MPIDLIGAGRKTVTAIRKALSLRRMRKHARDAGVTGEVAIRKWIALHWPKASKYVGRFVPRRKADRPEQEGEPETKRSTLFAHYDRINRLPGGLELKRSEPPEGPELKRKRLKEAP